MSDDDDLAVFWPIVVRRAATRDQTRGKKGRTRNPPMQGGSAMRLKGREGERGDRALIVFVGRAMVRAFDNEVVIGDRPAVAEIRERMAVGIYQRKINIGYADRN
jgi:hypothetical protein